VYDHRRQNTLKAVISRRGNRVEVSVPGGGKWSLRSCVHTIRSAENAELRDAGGASSSGPADGKNILVIPNPGVDRIWLDIDG
jgi:hypothetical protein